MIKSHFPRRNDKIPAISEAFVAEWDAGDALGYYGAILSFIGTVVLGALALYQNHIIKTEADKKLLLPKNRSTPKICLGSLCASAAPVDFAEV